MTTTTPPILPAYPDSPREPVVDHCFGETVVDPWRWLEADVRQDERVADWVAAQSRFAADYLAQLPQRAVLAARMKALVDFERFGLPECRGQRVFFRWNAGLMNQAQLRVADASATAGSAMGRVLIDPNDWASDGAVALDAWEPSDDGELVAYSVQDGGSDWRTVKFVRVGDGVTLPDTIDWVKFSGLTWIGNHSVLTSRFPRPAPGQTLQALNYDQAIYRHRLGTPQDADTLVFATPDLPRRMHVAGVSRDGHWLVITSSEGTDPINTVHVARIEGEAIGPMICLIDALTAQWDFVDAVGDRLWFVSGADAPRKKIVVVDFGGDSPLFDTIVAEADDTLQWARIIGGRIVAAYLHNAQSVLRLFSLDGLPMGEVALPGPGSVDAISGNAADDAGYALFTSFTQPATVLRFDPASGESGPWQAVRMTFDPADYRVEQVFVASRDGTRVPMFVVRRDGVTGPVPTILYGYGGFNVSLTPWFSSLTMAWLESGGAYAVANLRGGGEFGDAWHDAGRRANKQNVFDDFIAAGEWLIASGATPEGGLAIEGRSNGGLLVGAVVNQRPDLFAAASPGVGVMDMLRFDRFTAGRFWVDDYGYPGREADWRLLRAYSPLHNIRDGVNYPAILVTTADTDDRVVPGHSFKYAAALQAAAIGSAPHLIRIETRAGHGSGKPIDKQIDEAADIQAFFAQWTGLAVCP